MIISFHNINVGDRRVSGGVTWGRVGSRWGRRRPGPLPGCPYQSPQQVSLCAVRMGALRLWCCIRKSHPGRLLPAVVDSFPVDESPYGVRGMGGGVRDWCADVYRSEGPKCVGDRLGPPHIGDVTDRLLRPVRGGAVAFFERNARVADRNGPDTWAGPQTSGSGSAEFSPPSTMARAGRPEQGARPFATRHRALNGRGHRPGQPRSSVTDAQRRQNGEQADPRWAVRAPGICSGLFFPSTSATPCFMRCWALPR